MEPPGAPTSAYDVILTLPQSQRLSAMLSAMKIEAQLKVASHVEHVAGTFG